MTKLLFIDRDGTLIREPQPDQKVDALEKLELLPGVVYALARLARETDYELVMVTNQDGLGTPDFPENTFQPAQDKLIQLLAGEGIVFRSIHIDRSYPSENKPTRKPGTAMLTEYLSESFDLANSYVVGDRLTDVQLAHNLGAKAILLRNPEALAAVQAQAENMPEDARNQYDPSQISGIELIVDDWEDIYVHLTRPQRFVDHRRETLETSVHVQLELDGSGLTALDSGLNFLDHMIDQLARHGGLNLALHTEGDLHVDEHHSIEDTGIALGEALWLALRDKRGLERFGHAIVPMDEALATVAIDFCGRSNLVWNVRFQREYVGDVPTEMFYHFFKSLTDAAECTLHIRCEGENDHHIAEAVFKGVARALRMAVRRDASSTELPTTKGTL
jgi:imidazoleglycerol-phosphate dehydratase/histidinol-phosphatase